MLSGETPRRTSRSCGATPIFCRPPLGDRLWPSARLFWLSAPRMEHPLLPSGWCLAPADPGGRCAEERSMPGSSLIVDYGTRPKAALSSTWLGRRSAWRFLGRDDVSSSSQQPPSSALRQSSRSTGELRAVILVLAFSPSPSKAGKDRA